MSHCQRALATVQLPKQFAFTNKSLPTSAASNYMNDVRLTEWWDVLPQLAFAVLGWNLDHSRLVDDARCPVALLNDANDPRLVPFLLLDVLAERSRLLSRKSNQKTAYTQDNQQMQHPAVQK